MGDNGIRVGEIVFMQQAKKKKKSGVKPLGFTYQVFQLEQIFTFTLNKNVAKRFSKIFVCS